MNRKKMNLDKAKLNSYFLEACKGKSQEFKKAFYQFVQDYFATAEMQDTPWYKKGDEKLLISDARAEFPSQSYPTHGDVHYCMDV